MLLTPNAGGVRGANAVVVCRPPRPTRKHSNAVKRSWWSGTFTGFVAAIFVVARGCFFNWIDVIDGLFVVVVVVSVAVD